MTSDLLYETFEIVNSFSMIIYQSRNQNLEERNNNLYFLINSLQFLLYCVSNSQSFPSRLAYHQKKFFVLNNKRKIKFLTLTQTNYFLHNNLL